MTHKSHDSHHGATHSPHGTHTSHSHGGHSQHGSSHSHSHGTAHSHHGSHAGHHGHGHGTAVKRTQVYSKVFRWHLDPPGSPMPVKVEIVGSFTGWQKVPMKYDRTSAVWQVTLENIPGNCTHNYMLLVNGRPTKDKNSDGLAMPHTDEEKQYALDTPRGPRVFMLFSQTK